MTPEALRPPECVNLADVETGRDHLSHTAIGTFLQCEQKFNWHYEERLDPAVLPAALSLGRAFAIALETGDPEAGVQAITTEVAEETERAAGSPWVAAPDVQDGLVKAAIVEAASRAYLDRYGAHDQTREVEYRARIRNPETGGRYSLSHDLVARVDAIDRESRTLIEDKLQSQIPRRSLGSTLKLDRQVTIGCYMAWRCEGVEIQEVRYRITKKPGIRQRQNESHDGYLARIHEEYATKPDDYLHEEVVTRTADDFLRFEQELWVWTEQIRRARKTGVWPRNISSCLDFGGCDYLPLCAREPGARHQFVTRPERDRAPAVPVVMRENQSKEAA